MKALFAIAGGFFTQFKLYFILAGVAALTIGTATVVWRYKSAMAEKAVQEAVDKTNKEAQGKIDLAQKQAEFYRDLADKKYGALMNRLSKIRVEKTEITNNIRTEVATNPEFYNQPLPTKGWDQWIKARNLFPASPATTSSGK